MLLVMLILIDTEGHSAFNAGEADPRLAVQPPALNICPRL